MNFEKIDKPRYCKTALLPQWQLSGLQPIAC